MIDKNLESNLQKEQLNILRELSKILDRENIPFFLAYGTMLGCIRHNGFIPWDDDVDIYIWGKDYPRLKSYFMNHKTGFLQFHDFETVQGYPYVFPKVVDGRTQLKEKTYSHLGYMSGVYIDIFPLFEVEDNPVLFALHDKMRYLRYALIKSYYVDDKRYRFPRNILIKILKKFVNPDKIQKTLYQTYIGKHKGSRLTEPNIFGKHSLVRKTVFDKPTYHKYEGLSMPIPTEYDEYLTTMYGEYMKLPPEDQRVHTHSFAILQYKGI